MASSNPRPFTMPVYSASFLVAGVSYEDRYIAVERHLREGDEVFLTRDRSNRFSRHAIEVRLGNGVQIGFVPDDDAIRLASFFDQGHPYRAYCSKILTGGQQPVPEVRVQIQRRAEGVHYLQRFDELLQAAQDEKEQERERGGAK